jgi:hypothetical protein
VIAPVVGVIVLIIWIYGINNRPVTNVSSANRDQMLAQGPPANYGLVYVHRGPLVGGLAVRIDVKLDNVNVAQPKVARFTRLVVAPGSHLLAVGSKTPFGQLKQIAEAQRQRLLRDQCGRGSRLRIEDDLDWNQEGYQARARSRSGRCGCLGQSGACQNGRIGTACGMDADSCSYASPFWTLSRVFAIRPVEHCYIETTISFCVGHAGVAARPSRARGIGCWPDEHSMGWRRLATGH